MASTDIDYEKWHDGVPYDVDALAELDREERADLERWLLARAGADWRDLEALLSLGTDSARAAVVDQLRSGTIVMRLMAAQRLPLDTAIETAREAAIIAGLAEATIMGGGLSATMDLAARYPTPAVIDGLFRSLLREDREMGVHAAALLLFLHGKAREPFDWEQRPLFLRFNTQDRVERAAAFRVVARMCGVDPEPYLGAWRA